MSEVSRNLRHVSAALLAGIGFAGYRAAEADASCNVSAKVETIARHLRGQYRPFRLTAREPANPHYIERVFAKDKNGEADSNKQFMIDPATITCGQKVVRYVGVTAEASGTMGHRYSVGYGSYLYLDVIKPSRTVHEFEARDPETVLLDPPKHLKITNATYDLEAALFEDSVGNYDPAFIDQAAPHHAFGRMIS